MASTFSLPRSLPEAEGVSPSALGAFVDALDRRVNEVHSLMVLRHGKVVAEGWWDPYGPDRKHLLFSLTKSFTSTAVGLAMAEGRLGLDDPVVKFFPGVAPARPSRYLAALTVRHLLTMSTGRLTDSTETCFSDRSGDWVKGFFAHPWRKAPGEPFVYDTGASHVLGAIVTAVTGEDLAAYLKPRLFDPLGIDGSSWWTDPKGRRTGGFGLSLTTEAVAKFGQLLLQKGIWEGKVLLSADWVGAATSKQVANDQFSPNPNPDWRSGYGFQFWQGRHGTFRGDGAFGQFCVVFPRQEAVLAVTAGTADMGGILEAAWTHLVPALADGPVASAPAEARALVHRLATLGHGPVPGTPTSSLEPRLGTHKFIVEPNPQGVRETQFAFSADSLVMTVEDLRGTHRLEAGRGVWKESASDLLFVPVHGPAPHPIPLVSSFAWTGPQTLTLVVRMVETPFVFTFQASFEGRCFRWEGKLNVNMGPLELPRLVGVERRC